MGTDPAGTGDPHLQKSTNRFALLAGDDKDMARMRGGSTWKGTGSPGPGGAPSDGGQGYIFQAHEGI